MTMDTQCCMEYVDPISQGIVSILGQYWYGTCQKECNKRVAVALENMATFEPFSPTKSAAL